MCSVAQQALELHKRKAVESCQTAADLKLHLDKYQAQLKEAQVAMAEKTGALDQEAFKYRRMVVSGCRLRRLYGRSLTEGQDSVCEAYVGGFTLSRLRLF